MAQVRASAPPAGQLCAHGRQTGRQGVPDCQGMPDKKWRSIMSDAVRDVAETAQSPAGGSVPTKTLYCSFCIKSQHEVKKLISGPAGIFICDECVILCNEVVAGCLPDRSTFPSPKDLTTDRLQEYLRSIEDTFQSKADQLQSVVQLLRSRKVSWAQIGAALGISRQSAWERFT